MDTRETVVEAPSRTGAATDAEPGDTEPGTVHVLWLNAGLSCDGDSVALTSSTQPAVEDLVAGVLPGTAPAVFHWPLIAFENGDDFIEAFFRAERGELGTYVLVVEGSVPNEQIVPDGGYWAAFGNDPATGQPRTTSDWIDALAPGAWAVVAVGTCATYGGVPAMAGNPTGAMGVPDHLGWGFRSAAGVPIVCVPGCPTHPDTLAETFLYLLMQAAGNAPMIPLDDALRPTWLFEHTVHEGCDRGGFYETGQFADRHGRHDCIVKLGCWGPIVHCSVPKRGWINGVGGCPNVGGICIGCTMPGFPDKFMPFMDEPPGGKFSSMFTRAYGSGIRRLREFTSEAMDEEPPWRVRGRELLTGYLPEW